MKRRILLTMLCVILVLCAAMPQAGAEDGVPTLNLSTASARIKIYPDTYYAPGATGSSLWEGEHNGNLRFTGSFTYDSPIWFINNETTPVVYNVEMDNVAFKATDWASLICFYGQGDITLNITVKGSLTLEGHNHPVFYSPDQVAMGTPIPGDVTINITNPKGNTLVMKRRDNASDKVIYSAADADATISVTVNGAPVGNTANFNSAVPCSTHTYVAHRGDKLKDADCVSPLSYELLCSFCNTPNTEGRVITEGEKDADKHAKSLPDTYEPLYERMHQRTWPCCGVVVKEDHTFQDGECYLCGLKCKHNYYITSEKLPTETEAGHRYGVCRYCGNVKEETLPPLTVPVTGDESGLWQYIGLMAAAFMMAAAAAFSRAHRKNN
ncbi:MAG: hypothetical protein E7328_07605 [Clostridiales bacterium]|nr:hypothetical protein [Clostridiales bacterium]